MPQRKKKLFCSAASRRRIDFPFEERSTFCFSVPHARSPFCRHNRSLCFCVSTVTWCFFSTTVNRLFFHNAVRNGRLTSKL